MSDNSAGEREREMPPIKELHQNFEALEGAVQDAIAVMRGEANELAGRDDVDEHLGDVIRGLQYGAWELENQLENPPGDRQLSTGT